MPRRQEAGAVLFSRGSQDESTADEWDDTELLKEYDRAVRPLKALVAERMGLSTAEVEEASANESCASSQSVAEKEVSKGLKRNPKKRNKKGGKNKQRREWAVGDHCQAVYSADNKWYEATILSIDVSGSTCIVQYVGYGNTEEKPLSTISHSMGAAVRREQGRVASMDKNSEAEAILSDYMERSSQASSSLSHFKGNDSGKKNKHHTSEKFGGHGPPQPPNFDKINGPGFLGAPGLHPMMHDMVPPPLPPHILSGLPSDDSEALSAMLMSWYMSGFHTGYYQGLKRAKSTSPSPHTRANQ